MNAPSIAPSKATQWRADVSLVSGARMFAAAGAGNSGSVAEVLSARDTNLVRWGPSTFQAAAIGFTVRLLPDLDFCYCRHPGHEAPLAIAQALVIEEDLHGHALDDAGEVASGVVRRQERELRTTGRRNAVY